MMLPRAGINLLGILIGGTMFFVGLKYFILTNDNIIMIPYVAITLLGLFILVKIFKED